MITIDEFRRLELKVAKILEARLHPDAQRLLVLTVDAGGAPKEIVAGIAQHYQPQELVGKLVAFVDNMEPAAIRGVTSHGMVLAAQGAEGLSLLVPERPLAAGSPIR